MFIRLYVYKIIRNYQVAVLGLTPKSSIQCACLCAGGCDKHHLELGVILYHFPP